MSCLDDSTILRWVSGRLEGPACRAAEEELGRCGRCAALVAELLRDRDDLSSGLQRLGVGPLVAERLSSRPARARRFVRRHRTVLAIASLCTVGLAIAAAASHRDERPAVDTAGAEPRVAHDIARSVRNRVSLRSEEARAELLQASALRTERDGDFHRARNLHLESSLIHRRLPPSDPRHARALLSKISDSLTTAARLADELSMVSDAEREWSEARAILSRLRAEHPTDLRVIAQLGEVDMRVGRSRYLRGRVAEAQASYEQALAALEPLAPRAPDDSQSHENLAWSQLGLGDILVQRGKPADAEALYLRALAIAQPWTARDAANARWLRILARTQTSLGEMATLRADRAAAAQRHDAARAAYDRLVRGDPGHRGFRRGYAVVLARLADAEHALHHRERARRAYLAALDHLGFLAEAGAPEARLEWAYGLRGYAAFERSLGRSAAARKPLEQALELIESTPAATNRANHRFYRAAVLGEVGFHRAATGQPGAARNVWHRALSLLRELAASEALEPDGHALLREIEAALDRTG